LLRLKSVLLDCHPVWLNASMNSDVFIENMAPNLFAIQGMERLSLSVRVFADASDLNHLMNGISQSLRGSGIQQLELLLQWSSYFYTFEESLEGQTQVDPVHAFFDQQDYLHRFSLEVAQAVPLMQEISITRYSGSQESDIHCSSWVVIRDRESGSIQLDPRLDAF